MTRSAPLLLGLLHACAAFAPIQRHHAALHSAQHSASSRKPPPPRGGALGAAVSRDELVGEATGTALLLTFGYGSVATAEFYGASLGLVALSWGFGKRRRRIRFEAPNRTHGLCGRIAAAVVALVRVWSAPRRRDHSPASPRARRDATTPRRRRVHSAASTRSRVAASTRPVASSSPRRRRRAGVALGALVASDLSGAHLNPAVTASLAAAGKFPWKKVAPFVLAQLAGGVFASLLTSVTHGLGVGGPCPWIMGFGDRAAGRACFVEAWQTAVLAVAVFATGGASRAVPPKSGPFIVGATVSGLICLGGPLTGAGFNPARDVAPRLVAGLAGAANAFPAGWWAYTLGPVVGAVVGGMFAKTVLKSDG